SGIGPFVADAEGPEVGLRQSFQQGLELAEGSGAAPPSEVRLAGFRALLNTSTNRASAKASCLRRALTIGRRGGLASLPVTGRYIPPEGFDSPGLNVSATVTTPGIVASLPVEAPIGEQQQILSCERAVALLHTAAGFQSAEIDDGVAE